MLVLGHPDASLSRATLPVNTGTVGRVEELRTHG